MLLDQEITAYDFVRGHLRQYRELPASQTVQEELGIRLPAANEPLAYYIDLVNERYEYNLIRDRFGPLREALATKNMALVADTVSGISSVLRRRRRGASQTGEAMNMNEAGHLVTARLRQIQGTGGVSGITTGWPTFDYMTGGYQNGDMITWVGRMGLGKTYVMLRQAQNAHLAGAHVLFVTTEMSIEQMARRYAALVTGVNPTLLKNGTISTYMRERINAVYRDMIGGERFKVFSVGMNAKCDSIARLADEFAPDIIFIDGVYLLRPSEMGRNANRTEKVHAVYDELRGMNLDIGCPFVLSTQFNRQAGRSGKEGSLETISFTDAVGTHSSQVIALKDGPTENVRDSRVFDFLKGREGEHGSVAINFKFAPLDMGEMSVAEREAEGEVTEGTVQWMGRRSPDPGRRTSDYYRE